MKLILQLGLAFLVLTGWQLSAQNIITIIEKDRDGKYLEKVKSGEDTVIYKIKDGYTNNKISDINSILDIELNLARLKGKIGEIYEERLPESLAQKISALLVAMETRNRNLKLIEEIVMTYDYELLKDNTEAYDKYIDDLAYTTSDLVNIIELDDRILNEYYRLADSPDKLYSGVYDAASVILADLEKEIRQFTNDYGIYLRFGGWLITKNKNVPVHLEGFDEIAPQAPYLVDRWQFIPTGDQIKELEEIHKLAEENRGLGLSILKITAQKQLGAIKAFGQEKLQELTKDLEEEIALVKERYGSTIDPSLNQILDSLDALRPLIAEFSSEIKTRFAYYKNIFVVKDIDANAILAHTRDDIDYIINGDGLVIKNKLIAIVEQFETVGPIMVGFAAETKLQAEKLRDEYLAGLRSFEAIAHEKASEFLYGKELDMAALEFSEEVYKLALTDLPSSTSLDLAYTGVRNDGDRLVLKMTVSDKDSQQQHTLETREIYLFRVLPHVITTVGVIFADPLANTPITTQFQMAPSCNFLFKGLGDQKCRRKSVAYNRLFDWGLGLHIAAPDFDRDDVPELTAGVVISTLHDYLQSGFAFNIFTGDPYWFFGLRFPIPTFNIGASSQVQVE